jgi:hypothetical protein
MLGHVVAKYAHLAFIGVMQICLQLAYVFVPIGTAVAAMTRHLLEYLRSGPAHSGGSQSGKEPGDFLTPLLPKVMFDLISCLVNVGVRMDTVAQLHDVASLRALDVVKQQVQAPHSPMMSGHSGNGTWC